MKHFFAFLAIILSLRSAAQRPIATMTAGETIQSEKMVYVDPGDGLLYKASYGVGQAAQLYCKDGIAEGDSGQVFMAGIVPFSGATDPGWTIYLDGTIPGGLTTDVPTGLAQIVGRSLGDGKMMLWLTNVDDFSLHYRQTGTTSPQTLVENIDNLYYNGALVTLLTLNLPPTPNDGDLAIATFATAVTVLTIDGNGNTIKGVAITSAVIGTQVVWKYYAGNANFWLRIK